MTLANGATQEEHGTQYRVDDSGDLTISVGDRLTTTFAAGTWQVVDQVGERLAPDWPAPQLSPLLRNIGELLGVKYGHYVHNLGESSKYEFELFNELDALSEAVLASVGLSIDSSSHRKEISEVREAIGAAFKVQVPKGRAVSSGLVTDMSCPRCGDTLFRHGDRTWCGRGQMDLSPHLAALLGEYCAVGSLPESNRAAATDWGGRWFCPADGRFMESDQDRLPLCPTCNRVLPGQVLYQLIEFHVHNSQA